MYILKHRRELRADEKCPRCSIGMQPFLYNTETGLLTCMKCRTVFMGKDAMAEVVKAKMVKPVEQPEPKGHVCPDCGKVCKNALGLHAHMRSHA